MFVSQVVQTKPLLTLLDFTTTNFTKDNKFLCKFGAISLNWTKDNKKLIENNTIIYLIFWYCFFLSRYIDRRTISNLQAISIRYF